MLPHRDHPRGGLSDGCGRSGRESVGTEIALLSWHPWKGVVLAVRHERCPCQSGQSGGKVAHLGMGRTDESVAGQADHQGGLAPGSPRAHHISRRRAEHSEEEVTDSHVAGVDQTPRRVGGSDGSPQMALADKGADGVRGEPNQQPPPPSQPSLRRGEHCHVHRHIRPPPSAVEPKQARRQYPYRLLVQVAQIRRVLPQQLPPPSPRRRSLDPRGPNRINNHSALNGASPTMRATPLHGGYAMSRSLHSRVPGPVGRGRWFRFGADPVSRHLVRGMRARTGSTIDATARESVIHQGRNRVFEGRRRDPHRRGTKESWSHGCGCGTRLGALPALRCGRRLHVHRERTQCRPLRGALPILRRGVLRGELPGTADGTHRTQPTHSAIATRDSAQTWRRTSPRSAALPDGCVPGRALPASPTWSPRSRQRRVNSGERRNPRSGTSVRVPPTIATLATTVSPGPVAPEFAVVSPCDLALTFDAKGKESPRKPMAAHN